MNTRVMSPNNAEINKLLKELESKGTLVRTPIPRDYKQKRTKKAGGMIPYICEVNESLKQFAQSRSFL